MDLKIEDRGWTLTKREDLKKDVRGMDHILEEDTGWTHTKREDRGMNQIPEIRV